MVKQWSTYWWWWKYWKKLARLEMTWVSGKRGVIKFDFREMCAAMQEWELYSQKPQFHFFSSEHFFPFPCLWKTRTGVFINGPSFGQIGRHHIILCWIDILYDISKSSIFVRTNICQVTRYIWKVWKDICQVRPAFFSKLFLSSHGRQVVMSYP